MKKNVRSDALKSLLSSNIKLFRVDSGLSQAELTEIAYSLGIEPYDLFKPESASSREVKKIINKLAKEVLAFAGQSAKLLNSVAKEGGPEKKEN